MLMNFVIPIAESGRILMFWVSGYVQIEGWDDNFY